MVLLALASLAATPDDEGDARRRSGELPWRLGGRLRFTVDAAAFPESAGTRLEVYVRIPPPTLATLGVDEHGQSRLEVSATLKPTAGGRTGEASQGFDLAAGDSGGTLGKVLMLPFRTRPGLHRLRVRLEDPNSRRRGLVYLGRRVSPSRRVEGEVVIPGPQGGRVISDVEFVLSETAGAWAGPFARGGSRALPNPERLYGVYQTELIAAFELQGRPGDGRPWSWSSRILDGAGRELARRDSAGPPGRIVSVSAHHDLATLPAGGYALEVRAWQEGDSTAIERRSVFSVAWRPENWRRDPEELVDEVHLLFERSEEERFAAMSPGEREAYLEDWWRERDPTPETAENESRATFLERADFANRTWTRSTLEPGVLSDMGRVFVRYGEPDEIVHQVIPAGDENLGELVRELNRTGERPTGDIDTQGLGGDQRPFEIWIYEGEARRPLNLRPDTPVSTRFRRRLLFLFVDEHGYGHYRLRYTTE